MIQFPVGDLYEFDGIPGMPEPTDVRSDLGLILKVEAVTLDGKVVVSQGRRITGRPLADITFTTRTEVPITDALAMIKRGIWSEALYRRRAGE